MEPAPAPECAEAGPLDPAPLTDAQLAAIARGLAHPVRAWIVHQFDQRESRTVGDIVASTSLAQSTVSEHLRILREAGILVARKEGSRTWYCVRRSVLRRFARGIEIIAS